jgi:hypothetical protein
MEAQLEEVDLIVSLPPALPLNKMNPEIQTPPTDPIPSITPPQTEPIPTVEVPKPKNNLLVILIVAIVSMAIGAVGFWAYERYLVKGPIAQNTLPSPTPMATADPTTNWKTYTNSKYNYSLKYPDSWSITEIFAGSEIGKPASSMSTSIAISPSDKLSVPRFQLEIDDPSANLSISQTYDLWFKNLKENQYYVIDKQLTLNINNIQMDSLEGFSTDQSGIKVLNKAYFFNSSANKYFDILTTVDSNSTNSAIIDQILSTFKFTNEDTSNAKNGEVFVGNAKDSSGKYAEFILDLPKEWKLTSQDRSGYKITKEDISYNLLPNNNPGAGGCPTDNSQPDCTYNDTTQLGNIKTLRIWKNNGGVFMLNPQNILINGYMLNNFLVTKISPNTFFSQQEISDWENIFKNIKAIPSDN